MKIAIPVWENRAAPVFDAAEKWMLIEKVEERWTVSGTVPFESSLPEEKVREILDRDVKFLICGAIPYRFERYLNEAGCEVKSFVSGEPDELMTAWVEGTLDDIRYCMPGCRRGPAGRRGRQGRRGNGRWN